MKRTFKDVSAVNRLSRKLPSGKRTRILVIELPESKDGSSGSRDKAICRCAWYKYAIKLSHYSINCYNF